MQVFKLCIKIYKKNIPVMMIYLGVFIGMTVLMSFNSGQQPAQAFEESRANVAFFTEEYTPLTQGLKDEIAKIANFVDIEDNLYDLQDALYFRKVDYMLRIPAGFSDALHRGEVATIEVASIAQSSRTAYVNIRVNHYLNTLRLMASSGTEMSQNDLRQAVAAALEEETMVEKLAQEGEQRASGSMLYSFNYLAYSMMFVLIMGMSLVLLIMKKTEIKRRNAVSPVSSGSINRQLIAANLMFTLLSWVVMVSISLLFNLKSIGGMHTWYFILNSFIFTLGTASISFLIGSLVKSGEGISAVANTFTLGSSFLGGVFVPQILLGDNVLRVASFLPVYWYVKANDRIAELSNFGFDQMREVFGYMAIVLGFAIAFLVLALVIGKRKQLAMEEH